MSLLANTYLAGALVAFGGVYVAYRPRRLRDVLIPVAFAALWPCLLVALPLVYRPGRDASDDGC